MESPQKAHPPRNPIPQKLVLATVVCAIVGVGLLLATVGLVYATGPASAGLEFVVGLGLFLSVPLVYLVTPLLGWLTGLTIRSNWEAIVSPDGQRRNESALRLLARQLLTTGLLLGLVSALPAIVAMLAGLSLHVAVPGGLSILLVVAAAAASYLGYVAARLYAVLPGRTRLRIVALSVVPVGVLVPASHLPIGGYGHYLWNRGAHAERTPVYDGNSVSLARTAIVPTLDTPRPRGKNAIWCASFQLAWNELRDNVIGAPLKVVGAELVAGRLNAAQQSLADLEPGSVYAAAGWTDQGIIDTIEQDMAARFPPVRVPDFNDYRESLLAYAYLTAQVPFKFPFRQVKGTLIFTDSQGLHTGVEGFGVWQGFLSRYKNMREQVDIVFCRSTDPQNRPWDADEYAVDLCKHSTPCQVVVAVVEPKASLAETYEQVRLRAEEFRRREHYEEDRQLQEPDVLEVPEMFWEIDHRFEELIGKGVANVGIPIVEAMQTIRFRLDRSGAMLESEAQVAIAARPREFVFDRPFLVYIKKRGADQPFFVMWVDNAELLVAR